MIRAGLIRRLMATAALLVTSAYSYEGIYGAVRDGVVHHESELAAVMHQQQGAAGDHGHEDGLPVAQHHHGPQHRHGTAADHCTHVHGAAEITSISLVFDSASVSQPDIQPLLHTASSTRDEFRPPKA